MSNSFVQRTFRSACLSLAALIAISGMFPVLQADRAYAAYADIRGHAHEQLLSEWIDEALLQGYGDGTVQPDRPITRAEFMALINRSFGLHGSADIDAPDLRPGDWRYEQAAIAVRAGYLSGYADRTIRPDRIVTLQEAAVMLARLLKSDAAGDSPIGHEAMALPDWSRDAAAALIKAGVLATDALDAGDGNAVVTRAEAVALLDRALDRRTVTFTEAGVYGPGSDRSTIRGNVLLNAGGITLRNTAVTGSLIIGEGVGEGDVTLDNVLVQGDTIVNGGGGNSIHFKDAVTVKIVINKKTGEVRIVAEGRTNVQQVNVQSAAKIDNSKAESGGFSNVKLDDKLPGGSKVSLLGNFDNVDLSAKNVVVDVPNGSIKNLNVSGNAGGTQLNLGKNAKVSELLLKAPLNVTGEGQIDKATIDKGAESSTFQTKPGSLAAGPGANLPAPPVNSPAPADPTGGSDDDKDEDPAPVEAEIESAVATNGTIVAQMSRTPPAGLTAAHFTVMRSINGGEAVQVTPTAVSTNPAQRTVTLSVPVVPQTNTQQTVIYTVTYRSVTVTSNAYVVEPIAVTVTGLVYQPEVTMTGSTLQLTLQALMSDHSLVDVTGEATGWSSSNESVATVSASGLLSAVAASGHTIVTAEYAGFTATYSVTIFQPYSVIGVWTSLDQDASDGSKVNALTKKKVGGQDVYVIPAEDEHDYLIVGLNQPLAGVDGVKVYGLSNAQAVNLVASQYLVIQHDQISSGLYSLEITGLRNGTSSPSSTIRLMLQKLTN